MYLSNAKENTANQKPGKQLHILRYATCKMQREVFHSTFASLHPRHSYASVILRSAPILFNSYERFLTLLVGWVVMGDHRRPRGSSNPPALMLPVASASVDGCSCENTLTMYSLYVVRFPPGRRLPGDGSQRQNCWTRLACAAAGLFVSNSGFNRLRISARYLVSNSVESHGYI